MTIFETVFLLFDVCVGRMLNGEVLLAGMEWGIGTFISGSIGAAMVMKNRAGGLSLVDSSYCGTDWPRPLEWTDCCGGT